MLSLDLVEGAQPFDVGALHVQLRFDRVALNGQLVLLELLAIGEFFGSGREIFWSMSGTRPSFESCSSRSALSCACLHSD